MKTQIFLLTIITAVLATGSAWAAKGDGGGDGDRARHRFERLDADDNGRIDREEFAKGGAFMFGRMDVDGDGVVTLAELEDHERRDRIARRFKRLDADGDGALTKAEFKAAGDRMFQRLDENEDGYLSMGEIRKRRHGGGHGPGNGAE